MWLTGLKSASWFSFGNRVPESQVRWTDADSAESLQVVCAALVSDHTDLLGIQTGGRRPHPDSSAKLCGAGSPA